MSWRFIAVAVCALALAACATVGLESCKPSSTRCEGNTVQVCKLGLTWSDAANCDDIAAVEGGEFVCRVPKGFWPKTHLCVPVRHDEAQKPEKKEPQLR
jgi:hypothetical protein